MKKIKTYKGAGLMVFQKQPGGYAVLLGKRTCSPAQGKWSVPGGGFERYDKDLLSTALRECREETALDFRPFVRKESAKACRLRFPFFVWDTYFCEVDADFSLKNVRLSELSELRFVPLSELKKYRLALFVRHEVSWFLRGKKKNSYN